VDLEINEGEVVLIRGESGCGKTTALNILTGNLAPDAGTIQFLANGHEDKIQFPQRWWQTLNPFNHFAPEWVARKGRVGREWQDIRLFHSQTLSDNVSVAATDHPGENPALVFLRSSSVRQHEHRVVNNAFAVLARLGLKGRETSSADKISLGQAKRVGIARAVHAEPRILFLDEPLSGLDGQGAQEVLTLLKELALKERLTMVIVEHVFNTAKILEFASSVWTLKNGNLSVESPVVARAELVAASDSPVAFIQQRLTNTSEMNRHQIFDGAELLVFTRKNRASGAALLEVKDLVVYRGNRLVVGNRDDVGGIHGISFKLHRGDIGVLVAANGNGKTTIAEALLGLAEIARGQILFNGVSIEHMPTWKRVSLGLALLQARNHTFSSLSTEESLKLAGIETRSTLLTRLLHRRASQLSGGEKAALAFESTIRKTNYTLAILDEPFSALDAANVEAVFSLIEKAEDRTFLICLPDHTKNPQQ
jgi:ABC-type branched-subunit amino acid transport system ATPase component